MTEGFDISKHDEIDGLSMGFSSLGGLDILIGNYNFG